MPVPLPSTRYSLPVVARSHDLVSVPGTGTEYSVLGTIAAVSSPDLSSTPNHRGSLAIRVADETRARRAAARRALLNPGPPRGYSPASELLKRRRRAVLVFVRLRLP